MTNQFRQTYIKFANSLQQLNWDNCYTSPQNAKMIEFLKTWPDKSYSKTTFRPTSSSSIILQGTGGNFLANIWSVQNTAFVIESSESLSQLRDTEINYNLSIKILIKYFLTLHHKKIYFTCLINYKIRLMYFCLPPLPHLILL